MREDAPVRAALVRPDWPAPSCVHVVSTTRMGGVSMGPWATFDLATHCGDDSAAVAANRAALRAQLQLPGEPVWLEQVHGTRVLRIPCPDPPPADAAWTDAPGAVCAILTADCLPVVLCDRAGTVVAVAHAGWRGLVSGVLEATLAALPVAADGVLAWLGPCIGPQAFEVGDEVRAAYCAVDARDAVAFTPAGRRRHFHADLPGLARRRLERAGVRDVRGGHWCTFSDPAHFYSYRRDGVTGRMATLAWLAAPPAHSGRVAR